MNTIKNFEIIEIYNIRTKMFNNLIKAYIYKRKHYNSIIQSANYKRIHMEWLITKTNENSNIIKYLNIAFRSKSMAYREYIIASNMEMIHLQSMIDKVNIVKRLNEEKIKEEYNIGREIEINKLSIDLCNSDWTENEKKTLNEYYLNIDKYDDDFEFNLNKFRENIFDIENIDNKKKETEMDKKIINFDTKYKEYIEEFKKLQSNLPSIAPGTQYKILN